MKAIGFIFVLSLVWTSGWAEKSIPAWSCSAYCQSTSEKPLVAEGQTAVIALEKLRRLCVGELISWEARLHHTFYDLGFPTKEVRKLIEGHKLSPSEQSRYNAVKKYEYTKYRLKPSSLKNSCLEN